MEASTAVSPRPKAAGGPGRSLLLLLIVLLVAQIGLSVVMGTRSPGADAGTRAKPLLAFDPAAAQRVVIDQKGLDQVVLEKTDKGWQVQSLHGFPAAHGRVDALLERLAGMQRGLPVATTQDALARLNVADEDYDGHLTIEGGGTQLASLYLGDSAGARQRYVRPAGDDGVYESELSVADIPARADDWVDRALLNLDEREIQQVTLPGVSLERGDGGWRLAGIKDGETLDQAKAEDLVRRLGSLTFVSVLGTEDKPEYGQASPVLEWTVGLASGDKPSYRLSRLSDETGKPSPNEGETPAPKGPEWYVLKASHHPFYLKLAGYSVSPLLQATRESLLVETKPDTETAAPSPAEQSKEPTAPAEPQATATPEATSRSPTAETTKSEEKAASPPMGHSDSPTAPPATKPQAEATQEPPTTAASEPPAEGTDKPAEGPTAGPQATAPAEAGPEASGGVPEAKDQHTPADAR